MNVANFQKYLNTRSFWLFLASLFLMTIFVIFGATSLRAQSSIADNVCKGLISTETGVVPPNITINSCKENGNNGFGTLAQRIINIFSVVVGAVSVIMIIVGGFRYIISGGDSSGVTGAKNTIIYAIVGLVIVLFAQVIIRFVLTNVRPSSG